MKIINQRFFTNFISKINHYLLSVIIVGVTAVICTPFSNSQSYHVVSFVLLFVVSFLATFMRMGSVLLASTLSALVWNFFFIPPHYTFHIDKVEDILMFGMFFIIALLNGVLTTRVRRQEQLARDREERTNALFQITKELSKASGIDDVLTVAIEGLKNHFAFESFFILQDENKLLLSSDKLPKEMKLSKNEFDVANWVFEHSQKAGKFTDTLSSVDFTFYPLLGTRLNPGVVAVKLDRPFSGDKKIFLDTFITLFSNAMEREFLGKLAQKARFLDESDRLYKALFNSISHELRIPVATIMGATDTLLTSPHSGVVQSVLYNEIFTASIRLNRLIENLLNMSRLESGRISVHLDWYDINDLINKVTEDLKDDLKPFSLIVSIPDDIPLVKIDYGLLEHVLYNILFNASQHAPVTSNIRLNINYVDCELIIQIMDRGPGFSDNALNNVFKKFFRVDGSKAGGLGLGLSIVKGFVEAHNGLIIVENRKNGGARFTIRIPTETPEIKKSQLDEYE
ncbi:MAG: DUF4118 domain-containing protein [Bacteroidota bacterium]